jgi:putative peptidoglycan lipid II flippase
LALATTLSALANMLLLLWFLRRKIGPFGGRGISLCGIKSLAASIPMTAAVYYACQWADWSLSGNKLTKLLVLGGAIGSGVLVYAAVASLLRSDEALEMISILRKRLGRKGA